MKKEKKNSILKIILVMQKKKKKNGIDHDIFWFLSLSLCLSLFVEDCLLFRHVLSRPLYTTICLAMPCYTRKISYQMFNNLHKLIERGYRRNKVAR